MNNEIITLINKASSEGLNREDAILIEYLLSNQNLFKDDKNNYKAILIEYQKKLKDTGVIGKYSSNNIEYIKSKTQLLGLIFANDKHRNINMYSEDSFHFLCQFHSEKTPSMGVTNNVNQFYCFGCNVGGTIIKYVMKIYNVSFLRQLK